MKRQIVILMIFLSIFTSFIDFSGIPSFAQSSTVETAADVKHGAVGGYVWELQGRLHFLGFYHGKVDGIFGWTTYWAVRNFQYKFGLPVDGVVGPKTKSMLWKATKNWKGTANTATITSYSSHGFSDNDIKLMANAVYGESRGEPFVGQVAVAAVILNRVKSAAFPKSPSGVIFQPGAFTAVSDGQIWLTPNAKAKQAVLDAINGWDPSSGAIYYFNPNTATSGWIWSRPQIKKIGKHIFCR